MSTGFWRCDSEFSERRKDLQKVLMKYLVYNIKCCDNHLQRDLGAGSFSQHGTFQFSL